MNKHERRMEELMHNVCNELEQLVYFAAIKDGRGWERANSVTRSYRNITNDLRSAMYDELNEPRGIKRLLSFFKGKGKK